VGNQRKEAMCRAGRDYLDSISVLKSPEALDQIAMVAILEYVKRLRKMPQVHVRGLVHLRLMPGPGDFVFT